MNRPERLIIAIGCLVSAFGLNFWSAAHYITYVPRLVLGISRYLRHLCGFSTTTYRSRILHRTQMHVDTAQLFPVTSSFTSGSLGASLEGTIAIQALNHNGLSCVYTSTGASNGLWCCKAACTGMHLPNHLHHWQRLAKSHHVGLGRAFLVSPHTSNRASALWPQPIPLLQLSSSEQKKNSSNSSSSQELVCSVLECMATTTMDLIPHCALCAGKFRNHHGEHPPPGPLHWTTVARSGMNDISLRVYLLFANFVILIINSSRARWTRGRHCATSNGPRLCYSTPCGSSP